MEEITAISNERIRRLKRLATESAYRHECGLFIAEGYNLVKDIPIERLAELYITKNALAKYPELSQRASTTLISDKIAMSVSDTKSPSGIFAVCKIVDNIDMALRRAVLLDGVSDPGNVGTIIRTCAACSIDTLLTHGEHVDIYSPKVVRASMGGVFDIHIRNIDETDITGIPIYALDMNGENIFGREINNESFILAVGSEAHGVSKAIRERADRILSLPMSGNMESLNAGVSLSIALYQLIYGGK